MIELALRPSAASPTEAEMALTAFLTGLRFLRLTDPDQDLLGPTFAALSPRRQADLVQAVAARHASRLAGHIHADLIAVTRLDRHDLEWLAAVMAESEAWW